MVEPDEDFDEEDLSDDTSSLSSWQPPTTSNDRITSSQQIVQQGPPAEPSTTTWSQRQELDSSFLTESSGWDEIALRLLGSPSNVTSSTTTTRPPLSDPHYCEVETCVQVITYAMSGAGGQSCAALSCNTCYAVTK